MSIIKIAKLSIEERTLLKTASKHYLESNQLARDFREMLIKRECIYPLTTLSEFMNNREDLIEAIKLNWLLGYSDQITPKNLSKGLVSDYEFIQFTPNFNASIPTNDVDILKNLTIINKERRTMRRNIDSFIRSMGWIEEDETERLPKKRAISKDEVIKKVDNLLDNSSTVSSSTTGTLYNSTVLSKSTKSSPSDHSVTTQESNNSTRTSELKVTNVPDIINIDDDNSEVTDSMDFECKKFLKKILKKNGDNCGIITYLDTDGDVQMNIINEKKLDHVMACVIEYDMKKND